MASTSNQPAWLSNATAGNYAGAKSYLSLVCPVATATRLVARLRVAKITQFKAKDIFRASQLSLLGVSNFHVEKDRVKLQDGTPLSPILLVRNAELGKVVVADGYHRLCAVYGFDEDALIPCKIV
jgi:hypothetical protein